MIGQEGSPQPSDYRSYMSDTTRLLSASQYRDGQNVQYHATKCRKRCKTATCTLPVFQREKAISRFYTILLYARSRWDETYDTETLGTIADKEDKMGKSAQIAFIRWGS